MRGLPECSGRDRAEYRQDGDRQYRDKARNRAMPVPELVMAAPGRALVRQGAVLDMWRVGSIAEDGRRVVSIALEDGRMVVRLDDGTVIEAVSSPPVSGKSR